MSPDSAIKKLIHALMDLGQRSNVEGMRQTLAEIENLERSGRLAEGQDSTDSKTSATSPTLPPVPPNRPSDTD